MNHQEAIAVLLLSHGEGSRTRVTADEVRHAEDHIARCSECWETLCELHAETFGAPPEGAERVRALYGCAEAREELENVFPLNADEIREHHPGLARHLSRCLPCRERYAAMLEAERLVADTPPLFEQPARQNWREVVTEAGARMWELAEALVIRIRGEIAGFALAPDGVPLLQAVPTPRDESVESDRTADGAESREPAPLFSQAPLTTPGGELSVGLSVSSDAEGKVSLTATVTGGDENRLEIALKRVLPEGLELFWAEAVPKGRAVTMRHVPPGNYVLEVSEGGRSWQFRIRCDTVSP